MNGFARIALTWLLALALPVQSYAAQAMLFCGPAHHGSTSAVAAHDHSQHVHLSSAPAKAVDDEHDSPDGTVEVTQGKCSTCASCCAVSAMVATPLRINEVHLSTTDHGSDLFEPHAGRMVGGLERPPRTFLA